MGLTSKIKSAVGMSDDGDSDGDVPEEDWMDDVDTEINEGEGSMESDAEMEMDPEPEEQEWDSAYQFADEYIEVRGFASMVDFTNKCMAHKINQSPKFRDRLQNGVQTMERIGHMQQQMQKIQGGGQESRSYKERADELKAANEVIDEAERLNGKEDAMVNEALSLGHELVESIANGDVSRAVQGSVQSNVQTKDEEM